MKIIRAAERPTKAAPAANFTGTGISNPRGIAAGFDGNMWFADSSGLIGFVGTGVVTGGVQPIRDGASDEARLLWRAASGVVGRLSQCDGQWWCCGVSER